MNLIALIPWEAQFVLALIALAGLSFLAFTWFGFGVARTLALWGAAAALALALLSRAFQKGQSHEIDRANRVADAAIRKAGAARARAERDALDGRLRDDDGFQRRD
ncbi:MAG: hypothetical protein K0R27_126 [Xanthobacteraceae bacterium]|jgi:membrane protein implicated in regulation of membrane protease activity|nr:hypothetical protein [Xanthobacteraceae bacterium]